MTGLLSRLNRIYVTYFDRTKIKEYNYNLNVWFQTAFGIKISMNIMRWSEKLLRDSGFYKPYFDLEMTLTFIKKTVELVATYSKTESKIWIQKKDRKLLSIQKGNEFKIT